MIWLGCPRSVRVSRPNNRQMLVFIQRFLVCIVFVQEILKTIKPRLGLQFELYLGFPWSGSELKPGPQGWATRFGFGPRLEDPLIGRAGHKKKMVRPNRFTKQALFLIWSGSEEVQ